MVGENSSGKTSFFALLDAAFEFFNYRGNRVAGNFDLGSFDDVIHKSSYSRSKEKQYSVSFKFDGDLSPYMPEGFDAPLMVQLIYAERKGRTVVEKVVVSLTGRSITLLNCRQNIQIIIKDGRTRAEFRLSQGDPSETFSENWLSTMWSVVGVADIIERFERGDENHFGMRLKVERLEGSSPNSVRIAACVSGISQVLARMESEVAFTVVQGDPIRSEPKRVYMPSSASGDIEADRIPIELHRMSLYEPERWSKLRSSLSEFGKDSGLFTSIDVRSLRGRKKAGPFEIIITRGHIESNIKDVGYGINQVVPFVVDLMLRAIEQKDSGSSDPSLFYIQQPEIHLHPSAQAALGTFFYRFTKNTNSYIIVETHSDYIVDRIRRHVRNDKSSLAKENVALLFFQNKKGISSIHHIELDSMGNIIDPPDGYREFFIKEELNNLGFGDVLDN
jgi:hypothetical protein